MCLTLFSRPKNKAPAWAWPSPSGSWKNIAGRLKCRAKLGAARPSSSRCRRRETVHEENSLSAVPEAEQQCSKGGQSKLAWFGRGDDGLGSGVDSAALIFQRAAKQFNGALNIFQ